MWQNLHKVRVLFWSRQWFVNERLGIGIVSVGMMFIIIIGTIGDLTSVTRWGKRLMQAILRSRIETTTTGTFQARPNTCTSKRVNSWLKSKFRVTLYSKWSQNLLKVEFSVQHSASIWSWRGTSSCHRVGTSNTTNTRSHRTNVISSISWKTTQSRIWSTECSATTTRDSTVETQTGVLGPSIVTFNKAKWTERKINIIVSN